MKLILALLILMLLFSITITEDKIDMNILKNYFKPDIRVKLLELTHRNFTSLVLHNKGLNRNIKWIILFTASMRDYDKTCKTVVELFRNFFIPLYYKKDKTIKFARVKCEGFNMLSICTTFNVYKFPHIIFINDFRVYNYWDKYENLSYVNFNDFIYGKKSENEGYLYPLDFSWFKILNYYKETVLIAETEFARELINSPKDGFKWERKHSIICFHIIVISSIFSFIKITQFFGLFKPILEHIYLYYNSNLFALLCRILCNDCTFEEQNNFDNEDMEDVEMEEIEDYDEEIEYEEVSNEEEEF